MKGGRLMESKEAILDELKRQSLTIDDLPEHELKSLIISARMKSVYEPLPEAVFKAYTTLRKHIDVQKASL